MGVLRIGHYRDSRFTRECVGKNVISMLRTPSNRQETPSAGCMPAYTGTSTTGFWRGTVAAGTLEAGCPKYPRSILCVPQVLTR